MKWYTYILCFILIGIGTICGIQFYKQVTAQSYINGSIDITNKFSQEKFNYSSTSVVFYNDSEDEELYYFEKDLLPVEDFDGEKNLYQVKFNDFVLTDTKIIAGKIESTFKCDFYNLEGEIDCQTTMKITIKFFSSKTNLLLETQGEQSKNYLEQYFSNNGIRLKVDKVLNKEG